MQEFMLLNKLANKLAHFGEFQFVNELVKGILLNKLEFLSISKGIEFRITFTLLNI